MEITKYFTSGAYENLIKMQEDTKKFMLNINELNENKIIKNFISNKIISFNKINFVMIFFNNDGQGISIIVKNRCLL